ncbi:hypothetical protein M9Y10_041826 [Tritrichomonas musculus]|uniref:Thioredoxin domain-containing protein n=1 Tax=Tritrichomonas musculus TaxID=1915356 RepID=A0ABR2K672_9EUKA
MSNPPEDDGDEVKNILKFDGDEKLLRSYIEKSPLACLVFSAVWCPSCRRLSQQIIQLAGKYQTVMFVHIDVQESPELSSSFGVVKIPTTKISRVDGDKIVEVAEIVGASATRLKDKLNELLPDNNAQEEPEQD